jgi:DNA invertase Pin-like site-specific DNA recombinase
MKVAYIRVSTVEQNEARQLEAMKNIGIEKYYTEKVSAKNVTAREQLRMMLDFVREGDEVYVLDFSRLSRSVQDLLNIVDGLNEKGVRLVSMKENLDSSTATGKLMLTMIGAIAEFERQNLLERQREGIAIAKCQHKYKGRVPIALDNWDEVYKAWHDKKISAVAATKLLGISRGTFYNRVHETEKIGGNVDANKE